MKLWPTAGPTGGWMMQLPIKPMLAALTDVSDAVLRRPNMAWEPKWDGHRLVVELRGDLPARLWSRSGRVATGDFPVLADALSSSGLTAVLDGEVVVMADGRPSFNALQNLARLNRAQTVERMRFMAFDVLEVNDREVYREPYGERREILRTLVSMIGSPMAEVTPSTSDGPGLWNAMELAKMEGMIGKPQASRYAFGDRGLWLKLKRKAREEFVVIGWTWGTGARTNEIGSLVLAANVNGSLVYAGKVGTGFSDRSLVEVRYALDPLRRPSNPLNPAQTAVARRHIGSEPVVWLAPERTAVVEYAEKSSTGIPRFPSFKGLR